MKCRNAIDAYVDFVIEQSWKLQNSVVGDPLILVEEKVDFSRYVPDGFGTAAWMMNFT